jgi:hypothetical protein
VVVTWLAKFVMRKKKKKKRSIVELPGTLGLLFLFLTPLAFRCVFFFFAHHSSHSPSYPPHHCPFTTVEPGYGVDLFADDYPFLLPAADLRMERISGCYGAQILMATTFIYFSTTRLDKLMR